MKLTNAVAVIGPPGAGKTILTMLAGSGPGYGVIRLHEHVPADALPGGLAGAGQLACLDNFTVITSAHACIERVVRAGSVHTLLLDGFPATGTQVSLFLSIVRQVASDCAVRVIELTADPMLLLARACARVGCWRCEPDPPRPAKSQAALQLTAADRCVRCLSRLNRGCGTLPASYPGSRRRYLLLADGIRQACSAASICVTQFDTSSDLDDTLAGLSALLGIHAESQHAC
jgi:adenylate kinase